jgi:hypothetical protein
MATPASSALPPILLVTAIGRAEGALASAAAVGVAAATATDRDRPAPVVVAELGAEGSRGPTMLASAAARRLETELGARGVRAAARGAVCWVGLPGGEEGLDELERAMENLEARAVVAVLPAGHWAEALARLRGRLAGAVLRCDLPRNRSLAALTAIELREGGLRAKVDPRGWGPLSTRRAMAGLDPGGPAARRSRRIASSLLR